MMKRIGYLILLLSVTACQSKWQSSGEPDVKETLSFVQVHTLPFTLVDGYSGATLQGESTRTWTSEEQLGVIGEGVDNKAFILRQSDNGVRANTALFYGEPVSGSELTVYLPWNEDASLDELAVQQYEPDAYAHFARNSRLCATPVGNEATFSYSGGLLCITCMENLGLVQSLRIQSAQWGTEVRNINRTCDYENPLDVYVKIPRGNYRNFNITYQTKTTATSMPALAEITVSDFECFYIYARQQSFSDSIDSLQGEGGSYSGQPLNY